MSETNNLYSETSSIEQKLIDAVAKDTLREDYNKSYPGVNIARAMLSLAEAYNHCRISDNVIEEYEITSREIINRFLVDTKFGAINKIVLSHESETSGFFITNDLELRMDLVNITQPNIQDLKSNKSNLKSSLSEQDTKKTLSNYMGNVLTRVNKMFRRRGELYVTPKPGQFDYVSIFRIDESLYPLVGFKLIFSKTDTGVHPFLENYMPHITNGNCVLIPKIYLTTKLKEDNI